jgi:subtilisin family serine protease
MGSTEDKISPAFGAFLAEAGPKERREGIVVYRAPRTREAPPGSVLEFRRRQALVRARASGQKKVEAELYEGVRKLGKSIGGEAVTFAGTGGGAMPVARVEVTPKMLPELARRPDVVAIMPNQRVRLITPKEVDYRRLDAKQRKDGVTWGLKQLGIPEVWAKSKGKGVRVAVLDTGVHGAHPALEGRVRGFAVIDSSGRRVEAKLPFDCGTHGTHVCGTIAGGKLGGKVSIGVAPEAELLAGAVLMGDAGVRLLRAQVHDDLRGPAGLRGGSGGGDREREPREQQLAGQRGERAVGGGRGEDAGREAGGGAVQQRGESGVSRVGAARVGDQAGRGRAGGAGVVVRSAGAARGRSLRLLVYEWHVDGGAACGGSRGAADGREAPRSSEGYNRGRQGDGEARVADEPAG